MELFLKAHQPLDLIQASWHNVCFCSSPLFCLSCLCCIRKIQTLNARQFGNDTTLVQKYKYLRDLKPG